MTVLSVTHDVKTTIFEARQKIEAYAQKEAHKKRNPELLMFPRGTGLKKSPIPRKTTELATLPSRVQELIYDPTTKT